MFPIHKKLELQWLNIFFLFIYLFIYFLFCLACQKVNCNKKALKILDHTYMYHLPLLKCFLFIYLFFLKYSAVEIILKENYFLKLGLDKLKVRTDQMFQA